MPTLTVSDIKTLVRDMITEATPSVVTDTELTNLINDGYKEVAVKSLSYEKKITKTNIPIARRISLIGENILKVHYVEYNLGSSCLGMQQIFPERIGHIPIDGYSPQNYFKWWNCLTIEPMPDVATYDLYIYASCIPGTVLTDSDYLTYLPEEFHECVWQFALTYASYKLKRYGEAAMYYNRYIDNLQKRKFEYVYKYADPRLIQDIPANVKKTRK